MALCSLKSDSGHLITLCPPQSPRQGMFNPPATGRPCRGYWGWVGSHCCEKDTWGIEKTLSCTMRPSEAEVVMFEEGRESSSALCEATTQWWW